MKLIKKLLFSTLLIFIIIYLLEYLNIDTLIQNNFYNFNTKYWLLDKNRDIWMKYIFYDIPRFIILFIGLLSLGIFCSSFYIKQLFLFRIKSIMIFLCITLTPLSVGYLKKLTNIACPNQLTMYGGKEKYIKVFEKKDLSRDCRCFPAGHASGGLALIILSILARNKKEKFILFYSILSFGIIIGIYKMLIGDHFLSHTLVSIVIAYMIYIIILELFRKQNENIIS